MLRLMLTPRLTIGLTPRLTPLNDPWAYAKAEPQAYP